MRIRSAVSLFRVWYFRNNNSSILNIKTKSETVLFFFMDAEEKNLPLAGDATLEEFRRQWKQELLHSSSSSSSLNRIEKLLEDRKYKIYRKVEISMWRVEEQPLAASEVPPPPPLQRPYPLTLFLLGFLLRHSKILPPQWLRLNYKPPRIITIY